MILNLIQYRINNSSFKFTDIFLNTKKLFEELKIGNSEFVLYKNIGHDMNDDIYKDIVLFFKRVTANGR